MSVIDVGETVVMCIGKTPLSPELSEDQRTVSYDNMLILTTDPDYDIRRNRDLRLG
jgi:hypothetical protein